MKRSRFSEEQIIGILKEHAAGLTAMERCRKHARDQRRDLLQMPQQIWRHGGAVNWTIENKGHSQRRACGLVGIDPRVHRYRSTRKDDEALRSKVKELAAARRRFGYRRLHILLRREGMAVNWKKLHRVYREERLTVPS